MSARGSGRRQQLLRVYAPFRRFFDLEASSSVLILLCVFIALVWANSPWVLFYFHLWEIIVIIGIGPYVIAMPLLHWINDGLIALFFLIIGLEIKRAVVIGELSRPKDALFPIFAAIGGMVIPVVCYLALTFGTVGMAGWAIPMATDIALALGILALLGDRIPLSLKIFLSTLAIADDIGSVIVIAIFYSHGILIGGLILAALIIGILILLNWFDIHYLVLYALLGIGLWLAFLLSGVHATIAGFLLAMTVPARARVNTEDFCKKGRIFVDEFEKSAKPGEDVLTNKAQRTAILALENICNEVQPPLQRIEHQFLPWVGLAIVPLFALANAGVYFSFDPILISQPQVLLGVIAGLLIGKPLGITLFAWLSVKVGVARLPRGVNWQQIHAIGWLGGIGFTMSLLFASIVFGSDPLVNLAKTGILVGSLIAGIIGLTLLGGTRVLLRKLDTKYKNLKRRLVEPSGGQTRAENTNGERKNNHG